MFLGVEISALQRHWAVQMCKQVFMFIFLLLVEYQVWLLALRSGVTQSTVREKSFLWQWKLVSKSIKGWPKALFLVMDSSPGECSHFSLLWTLRWMKLNFHILKILVWKCKIRVVVFWVFILWRADLMNDNVRMQEQQTDAPCYTERQ